MSFAKYLIYVIHPTLLLYGRQDYKNMTLQDKQMICYTKLYNRY